jgi:hypothetical protein
MRLRTTTRYPLPVIGALVRGGRQDFVAEAGASRKSVESWDFFSGLKLGG